MDPRRTRLFLDTLDERIVPDATPLAPPPESGHCHEVVTYTDGHTCGAGVATYYCVSGPEDDATSGGDGKYTTASDTVSYDNDQTPADDVITHADGSDVSNPGDRAVTQVGNLNDLQDKTVVITYADGHTSGETVATYDNGSDNNPYGDDTTTDTLTNPAPPDLAALRKQLTDAQARLQTNTAEITKQTALAQGYKNSAALLQGGLKALDDKVAEAKEQVETSKAEYEKRLATPDASPSGIAIQKSIYEAYRRYHTNALGKQTQANEDIKKLGDAAVQAQASADKLEVTNIFIGTSIKAIQAEIAAKGG